MDTHPQVSALQAPPRTFTSLPAWLKVFLLCGFVLPLSGIVLYSLFPGLTIAFFNGDPNPTAEFWCSVTASVDVLVSFLSYSGIRSAHSDEILTLVIRSIALYAPFHFGAFFFWSVTSVAHPIGMVISYPLAIIGAWAGLIAWERRDKTPSPSSSRVVHEEARFLPR
jgi:hypothetical protein